MKYKLLVVDVDGTLVGKDGSISPVDIEAIKKAGAAGILVALSTGRVIKACRHIIDELALDGYHMFFDGAVISHPQKEEVIYSKPINRRVLRRAIGFAETNGIYLELYTTDKFYAGKANWSDDVHRNYFGVEPVITDLHELCMCEPVVKAELISHSAAEDRQVSMFRKEFDGILRFSIAHSPAHPDIEFINIIDPGVSKGEALKFLALHYGIGREEVIAIGDGLNDIPLFEAAGTTVAMGNAFDELKKIADYITLDVESGGVAQAVEKFVL
jgi:Cof subfamily protein (haloacid dehalogenase superfamily)